MSRFSQDEPGEDGHRYSLTEVRQSTKLTCTSCNKALPMGSRAVFELDHKDLFVAAVYCDKDECTPFDYQMAEDRHPFDLED